MAVMKNEIREFQPVGMRVLAVDDNPTCLRVLDALLRKCQYHVTTTNQATTALKLLREKKNNFDLVISDVDMPDMDGFKLLELVGLEMDLPVIMLSAHGDTRLVMKGISYGACDYLLKPVRTEELKNIWQHVFRRHKCDPSPRARNTSDNVNGDSAEDLMGKGDSDHHNLGMKRKDQNNEEVENAKPNQDPSIKKQPRVVWSPELHRKFVAAVHQLGTNKVGPKKILELMNVEKLRKENVASHLQKYRLHLKRISCEAKETKLVASLRSPDSAHLPNGAPNGVRNSGCLSASRGFLQLQASYRSFSPDSAFSRLNNPTGNGSCGGITQSCHAHNSIDTMNRMNQSISNSHGMPMPPRPSVDRPQYRRCSVQGHGELSIINLDSGVNPTSSGFLDTAKSVFLTADSSVMLAGDFQDFQRKEFSGIQQSCVTAASNPEHSPNLCRSSDNWQKFVQSSLVLPEPSAIICSKDSTSDDLIYKNSNCTLTTFGVTGSHRLTSSAPQICGTPITRTDFQCWTPVLMSNIGESSNSTSIQDRNELQQNEECFLSNFTSGLESSLDPPHGVLGSFNHRLEPRGNGDYLYHLPRLHMSVDLTPTDTELHQVHLEEEQRTPQRCLDYDNIGFF